MMLVALVSIIGVVDAVAGRSWDHVALHTMVLAVTIVSLSRTVASRREVSVRADLYRWYERRASDDAERIGTVIDRALAAQRDGLVTGSPPRDRDGRRTG
jgi:hypothetical protein